MLKKKLVKRPVAVKAAKSVKSVKSVKPDPVAKVYGRLGRRFNTDAFMSKIRAGRAPMRSVPPRSL